MAEQNSQHMETPTVLHVVTTDSTLPSNVNAAVHAPTVDKVGSATSENKAEEPPPAPVPPQYAKKDCLPTTKNCVLKLMPLKQLDIDVWCNTVSNYHKFTQPKPAAATEENSGYTLCKRKSKADITGISLRTKGNIDYTVMMQSDTEDEDDEHPRKQNKI